MNKELRNRRAALLLIVEERLPQFAKGVKKGENGGKMFLHQDAFAADYQDEELILLGAAIKYAGEYGVELVIAGKSRETLK